MEYPLTRLDEKILSLKNASKKALVAYLVAGDPDLDSTLELMHGFVDAGVDILEVGVPFTDPIAEGPIIQAAHDRALKNNTSLKASQEIDFMHFMEPGHRRLANAIIEVFRSMDLENIS